MGWDGMGGEALHEHERRYAGVCMNGQEHEHEDDEDGEDDVEPLTPSVLVVWWRLLLALWKLLADRRADRQQTHCRRTGRRHIHH